MSNVPAHPTANVRVSVPGTPQANEAVLANSIPQTATVQRHEAKLAVTHDGSLAFGGSFARPASGFIHSGGMAGHSGGGGHR